MTFPFPVFSPAIDATVTFTDSSVDAVDRSTYTFSAQALGVAAANRKIVVAICYSTTASITSVTIGGVTASQVVAATGTGGMKIELWQAAVPTGTTGDIVIVHPGTSDRDGIGVWAVYGAQSAANDTGSSTGVDPLADTLNIPAGGVAIGAAVNNDAGVDTYTWTNLTENYDEVVEDPADHSGASAAFAAAQTALSISVNESSASTAGALVMASWGPL